MVCPTFEKIGAVCSGDVVLFEVRHEGAELGVRTMRGVRVQRGDVSARAVAPLSR